MSQSTSTTSPSDEADEALLDELAQTLSLPDDAEPGEFVDQPNGDPDVAPGPVDLDVPDDDLGSDRRGPDGRHHAEHPGFVALRHPVPRWTPFQAVGYALEQVVHPDRDYSSMCDHFAGRVYGYLASGWYDAKAHADWLHQHGRLHGGAAPRGALGYWAVGRHGHTAVCVGDDRWASNDIRRKGRIDVVKGSAFDRWGTYRGWAAPAFPNAGGDNRADPGAPWPVGAPVVRLSAVVAAARHDPAAVQGATTAGAADDVVLVERALVRRGLLKGHLADGSWGTSTLQAYAAWQRHLGYGGRDADGHPGRRSLALLAAWGGFAVRD